MQKAYSKNDLTAAIVILIVTFAVFQISPIRILYDSGYTMLFSQQLLWHHSFSVESGAFPALKSRKPGQILKPGAGLPYQLYQKGERFYDFYPPGSVILSMPYVALANAMGQSAMDENGVHDARGETRIQLGLSPLLMAILAVVIFFTSRMILSFRWSLLITATAAFGTQIFSNASRAVWSQTWGILVLGFVIWLIVRTEARQTRLPPVLLATCLSWLYFIRPTFSGCILAIALYVFIYHREILLPLILTGCAWLAAFVGYSEFVYGELQPPYYHQPGFPYTLTFREALLGNLISPSRGLFIYVPVLAFVAYLLARYRPIWKPGLVLLAVGVICAHLIVISLVIGWHGGHCYGPRLSTDLVPWFVLLGILAVQARLSWHERNPARDSALRMRTEWSLAVLLIACSIILNGIGGLWWGAWHWNMWPTNIDHDVSRVWDWKHPQFLGVSARDWATRVREPAP